MQNTHSVNAQCVPTAEHMRSNASWVNGAVLAKQLACNGTLMTQIQGVPCFLLGPGPLSVVGLGRRMPAAFYDRFNSGIELVNRGISGVSRESIVTSTTNITRGIKLMLENRVFFGKVVFGLAIILLSAAFRLAKVFVRNAMVFHRTSLAALYKSPRNHGIDDGREQDPGQDMSEDILETMRCGFT